ncbi:uncharacterized protein METZ01_LOCUS515184, partial [marine metagenome]
YKVLSKKLPIICGGTGLYIESILSKYQLENAPGPNKDLRYSLKDKPKEELMELFKQVAPHKYQDPKKTDTKNRIIRSIEIELDKKSDGNDIFLNKELDNFLVIGIHEDRKRNRDLIKERLIERINSGLIDEVENLINNGLDISRLDYFGLEYRFVGMHLKNKLSKEALIEKLNIAIGQFAKRQMSWFRRMEKRGIKIHWVLPNNKDEINNLIKNAI